MSTYVVTTPSNPEFAGKVYGIQFSNGKAVLSKETISPHLGLTVDYDRQSPEDRLWIHSHAYCD